MGYTGGKWVLSWEVKLAGGVRERCPSTSGWREGGCFRNKPALGWISTYGQAKGRGKLYQVRNEAPEREHQQQKALSHTDGNPPVSSTSSCSAEGTWPEPRASGITDVLLGGISPKFSSSQLSPPFSLPWKSKPLITHPHFLQAIESLSFSQRSCHAVYIFR